LPTPYLRTLSEGWGSGSIVLVHVILEVPPFIVTEKVMPALAVAGPKFRPNNVLCCCCVVACIDVLRIDSVLLILLLADIGWADFSVQIVFCS
jgi:hypothetical protein